MILGAAAGTAAFIIGMWLLGGESLQTFPGGLVAGLWLSAMFIAGPTTVLVGVPLYLFLRSRVRATLLNCAVAGGFVGALALVLWPVVFGATIRDLLSITLAGAACGGLGGLTFWLVSAREINRDFDRDFETQR